MKWVTRENANVDRIACPWLIKRFIDKEAEFIFVPLILRLWFRQDGAIALSDFDRFFGGTRLNQH